MVYRGGGKVGRKCPGNGGGRIGRNMPNDIPAIRTPTMRDLGWAAGFLEGEGTFAKNGEVKASQVNPDPLIQLQEIFGGHVRKVIAKQPNASDCWVWSTTGKRGRGIALTLYKLLSYKRRQQIERGLL